MRELWSLIRHPHQPGNTLKLFLLKQILNFNVKLADRFIPDVDASRLNTKILNATRTELLRLAKAEFNLIEQRHGKEPRNFERLLKTTFKTLCYLAEKDPYYDLWLGMAINELSLKREAEAQRYMRHIGELALTNPEFTQLRDPMFQRRCFNLKTCGGLLMLQESLEKTEVDGETKND